MKTIIDWARSFDPIEVSDEEYERYMCELERQRERARHNEASALGNARRKAEKAEREKWQGVIAEKDAEIARLDAEIARRNAEIARRDAEIERLRRKQ